MKPSPLVINSTLVFVALIWGLGFIPQRLGLETLGPMAFNAWRFAFGAITIIPILWLFKVGRAELLNKNTLIAGLILGTLLTAAAGFQQISLGFSKVANVAFITGFYVIFVPVFGLFVNHRYSLVTWLGGGLALLGLALLSGFQGEMQFKGDGLALLGAVFWALQLLVITYFVKQYNEYALAFYQFVFCAVFSLMASLMFESSLFATGSEGYLWALVNGVIVVGIAYTLQIVVLKHSDPFVASVIFSLESVFGAIAGYWFFQEILGFYGFIGAALMLIGCLLAQIPEKTLAVQNNN
jgi:drug/metabolite transporter (DMT)-like permease